MHPDDIKTVTMTRFPGMIAKRRINGWSFFVVAETGRKTRIFRAIRAGASSPTKLKRAVSSVLHGTKDVIDFHGSSSDLETIISDELILYHKNA